MNSKLLSFEITELFGDRTVKVRFEKSIKILVGENGLGKTTILNILYYTLTNKLYKLRNFDFKEIILKFKGYERIVITKTDVDVIEDNLESNIPQPLIHSLVNEIDSPHFQYIIDLINNGKSDDDVLEQIRKVYYSSQTMRRFSPRMILRYFKHVAGTDSPNNNLRYYRDVLKQVLKNTEILYFPTYRRIEEDLINLGLEKSENSKSTDVRLIQFGMADVKEVMESLKTKISNLSSEGLSQISTEILSQLVKGVPKVDYKRLQNISSRDVDIILARVGNALTGEDKIKITNLLLSKKITEIDDKYLIYFLQKLIEIYDKQKEIDKRIETFIKICNKYLQLSGKRIEYDASKVEFYFLLRSKKVPFNDILEKLSSGEKQIISIFTKIYLNEPVNFVVLFDEPELSLSIFWQRLLLPDIADSDYLKLLVSVTHSPFIYDNDLKSLAVGLGEYFSWK